MLWVPLSRSNATWSMHITVTTGSTDNMMNGLDHYNEGWWQGQGLIDGNICAKLGQTIHYDADLTVQPTLPTSALLSHHCPTSQNLNHSTGCPWHVVIIFVKPTLFLKYYIYLSGVGAGIGVQEFGPWNRTIVGWGGGCGFRPRMGAGAGVC